MLKLNLKDRKILSILDMNARTPLSQIAKQVGLSREVVHYRIQQLEKKGAIEGGKRFFVDVSLWGMENCFSYQYQMRVRPFPCNSGSEIDVVERYFSMPMESRAENPLGKMLAVLGERL